jgi:hypothetical protein
MSPARFLTELKNKFRNTQTKPSDVVLSSKSKAVKEKQDESSSSNLACLKVCSSCFVFTLFIVLHFIYLNLTKNKGGKQNSTIV